MEEKMEDQRAKSNEVSTQSAFLEGQKERLAMLLMSTSASFAP